MTSKTGQSVWMATAQAASYPPLAENLRAEVCVVGADIAGITTAYMLTQAGKSVVILEDNVIGSGATGRTTAHLSNALDARYFEIERMHGEKGARLAAQSHSAAINRIETILTKERITCGFERLDGYLFASPGEATEVLEREREAALRAGLSEVDFVERAPLAFDTGLCLRFPRQAQFHPLQYLAQLADIIVYDGGRIFTGTRVEEVDEGPSVRVRTQAGFIITADALVIATDTPINNRFATYTKQAAYRTYALAARVATGSVARALYWDTLDPHHSVRLQTSASAGQATEDKCQRDYDLLIVGGEGHKTGQADSAENHYARLEAWMRERFPRVEAIEFRWSRRIMEPVDGLAFIGPDPLSPKNIYIVTGDSGNGMTHGTIAGILLTDLILGRENAWKILYDPVRVTRRAVGKELAAESL